MKTQAAPKKISMCGRQTNGSHPDVSTIETGGRPPLGARRQVRGYWLVNTLVLIVLILLLSIILFPLMISSRSPGLEAPHCQCNMKQIGNALKMYLSDWNDHFPTNRQYDNNGKLGEIQSSVKLTPPILNKNNKPIRFRHGVNWVEGMYNYIEAVNAQDNPDSVWKCNVITLKPYPASSKTASVSYVFNRNLIEKDEKRVKSTGNLMMVRESDRLLESDLRPTNDTTWTSKKRPVSPFLTKHDDLIGSTNPKLHSSGSNILFADGHVKRFDYEVTKDISWDANTAKWYSGNSRIAITP